MQTTHSRCLIDCNEGLETPPQAYGLVVIALQPCKVVFSLDYHALAIGPAIEPVLTAAP